MLKSVLVSMPICFLSLYQAPASVLCTMESLQRDFLWGSRQGKQKIHWVGWSNICNSVNQGGLGIRSMRELNKALFYKWLWRFGAKRSLIWKQVVSAKYGEGMYDWSCRMPTGSMGCGLWKEINMDVFFSFIKFKVNKGDRVKFWLDVWCSREPLKDLFPSCFSLAISRNGSVQEHMIRLKVFCFWD